MSNAQSQWDFGEMFPEEPIREVLTVSDLTTRVKRELENRIGQIWVEGEITNLMGSDAQRIADLTPYLHALWFAPLQATAAMALELRGLDDEGATLTDDGDDDVPPRLRWYPAAPRVLECGDGKGNFVLSA